MTISHDIIQLVGVDSSCLIVLYKIVLLFSYILLVMSDESIEYQLLDALSSHNSEEALHLLSLLSNPHKVKYYHNSTILHYAAWHGVLDIVQVLINEYQFDPHCVDDNGGTPLHNAAITGHLNQWRNWVSVDGWACFPARKARRKIFRF